MVQFKLNISLLFLSVIAFCSCDQMLDPLLIRKKIYNNGVTVKWGYHSFITSTGPDIVSIESNGKVVTIIKANYTISNVEIKGDSLLISLIDPVANAVLFEKYQADSVFGYRIFYDTTYDNSRIWQIPDGKK